MYPYDWIDRFLREQRRLIELLEAPTKRALREMQSTNFLLAAQQNQLYSAANAFNSRSMQAAIEQAAKGWTVWQDEIRRAADLGREAVRIAQPPASLFKSIEELSAALVPKALALEAIRAQWQRAGASIEAALRFQATFAASIFEQFAAMAAAESEDEFLEAVDGLTSTVEQSAQRLPRSRAAVLGLWLTIMSILLTIHGLSEQRNFEIKLESHLEQTDRRLAAIESTLPEDRVEDTSECFVVTRRVNMRSGPSRDHVVRRVLERNTVVVVLEAKGPWLRVEAFDFVELDIHRGWVYKRFLEPLRLEP